MNSLNIVFFICLLFSVSTAQRVTSSGNFGESLPISSDTTRNIRVDYPNGIGLLIDGLFGKITITLSLVQTLPAELPNNANLIKLPNDASAFRLELSTTGFEYTKVQLIFPFTSDLQRAFVYDDILDAFREFSVGYRTVEGVRVATFTGLDPSGLYVMVESPSSPQYFGYPITISGVDQTLEYPQEFSVTVRSSSVTELVFNIVTMTSTYANPANKISLNNFWRVFVFSPAEIPDLTIAGTLHWKYDKTFVDANNINVNTIQFGRYNTTNQVWVFSEGTAQVDTALGVVSQTVSDMRGQWGVYGSVGGSEIIIPSSSEQGSDSNQNNVETNQTNQTINVETTDEERRDSSASTLTATLFVAFTLLAAL